MIEIPTELIATEKRIVLIDLVLVHVVPPHRAGEPAEMIGSIQPACALQRFPAPHAATVGFRGPKQRGWPKAAPQAIEPVRGLAALAHPAPPLPGTPIGACIRISSRVRVDRIEGRVALVSRHHRGNEKTGQKKQTPRDNRAGFQEDKDVLGSPLEVPHRRPAVLPAEYPLES